MSDFSVITFGTDRYQSSVWIWIAYEKWAKQDSMLQQEIKNLTLHLWRASFYTKGLYFFLFILLLRTFCVVKSKVFWYIFIILHSLIAAEYPLLHYAWNWFTYSRNALSERALPSHAFCYCGGIGDGNWSLRLGIAPSLGLSPWLN